MGGDGFDRLFVELLGAAAGDHHYMSTACLHGRHPECRLRCKFCDTPCLCKCHRS